MDLGHFIYLRRKHLHMTQEQLANKIFVSKSAVAKWETNGGIPDRDNLFRLAEVLKVSASDLYQIIEKQNLEDADIDINITGEVIAMLESYGYKVIRPDNNNTSGHFKEEME